MHTVIAADGDGQPIRVVCGFCQSEHNYRGGPRVAQESSTRGWGGQSATPSREVARRPAAKSEREPFPIVSERERIAPPFSEESGMDIEMILRRVMLRNRLRTLEQQVNAAEMPEDVKVKLQSYISGCYGSLTSFNILFAEEDDAFKGSGG